MFRLLKSSGMTRVGDFRWLSGNVMLHGHARMPQEPGLYAFVLERTDLVYLGMSTRGLDWRVKS